MDKIKVLWMNNGDEDLQKFVSIGKTYNLEITTCKCMTDCRHYLDDKEAYWDAVILNAEIKYFPNDKPIVYNLYKAADEIKEKKTIPWFVVITKEIRNKATVMGVLPDKERYYNIMTEYKELFKVIQIKVNSSPQNYILDKYADVCSFCNHPDLLKLLKALEFPSKSIECDGTIPNICRGLLEWLETSELFKKYNLSYKVISQKLEEKRKLEIEMHKKVTIPPHITRSFHFCCEVTNDGSHEKRMALTKELLRDGMVPYLNKSLILNLLNILHWCASQDKETFDL